VIVDLPHRDHLGRGAGQEDLLGEVELGAGDVAFDHRVAEVAGDLDHRLAVDPVEDRGGVRGVKISSSRTTKNVLARALGDEAALVEQDRLVVAGVGDLGLGEDRVEVGAGGLGVRIAPPGLLRRQLETLARMPLPALSAPR